MLDEALISHSQGLIRNSVIIKKFGKLDSALSRRSSLSRVTISWSNPGTRDSNITRKTRSSAFRSYLFAFDA